MGTLSSKQRGAVSSKEAAAPGPVPGQGRASFLLLLPLFCLLLSGCASREGAIKEDLTEYLDKARLWATTEERINTAIAAVRRDQFVHDDFVSNTLKPVVGIAQTYVKELESHHPRTAPLINVHNEYIEAWRAHYFAMAAIVDAVEKKDYIQLAKDNSDLLEAQRSVSDALADLARLLREAKMRPEPPPGQTAPSPQPSATPAPS